MERKTIQNRELIRCYNESLRNKGPDRSQRAVEIEIVQKLRKCLNHNYSFLAGTELTDWQLKKARECIEALLAGKHKRALYSFMLCVENQGDNQHEVSREEYLLYTSLLCAFGWIRKESESKLFVE